MTSEPALKITVGANRIRRRFQTAVAEFDVHSPTAALPMTVRVACSADRDEIFRLRHAVYATELQQHAPNIQGRLSDPLDEFNVYLIAERGGRLQGFVSITPPVENRYSIDKYLSRELWPIVPHDRLYEVRLLTVEQTCRQGLTTPLLMHAALRWIDEQGGTEIIAMGRREVLEMYAKAGFQPLGRTIRSGAVDYELMATQVERARRCARRHENSLLRSGQSIDWQLPFPMLRGQPCEHGGAFFQAIGEDFLTLDRRWEIINADVLDAWFPPAPDVLCALREHLDWAVRTSPPTQCAGLTAAISRARDLPAEHIVPGAGSSALIYLAFREWLTPGSRVLVLDPMYGEYRHLLEDVIGVRPDCLTLHPRTAYRVDLQQLEERCRRGYDLVVLVNPNNPTGQFIPRAALEEFLRRVSPRTRFWIDEAYLDYVAPQQSLEQFAAQSSNVVVCKSMSKVYALSGLRAAYACAATEIASSLRRSTPPWPIGLPGQIAAVKALESPDYYRARYAETALLRESLTAGLSALEISVLPGCANFLLCEVPAGVRRDEFLNRCREGRLFLRNVDSMGLRLGPRVFRIAVKDAETNARMLSVIGNSLVESAG